MLEFVEEGVAYIELAKTYLSCIEMILDRYELKIEYFFKIKLIKQVKFFNLAIYLYKYGRKWPFR